VARKVVGDGGRVALIDRESAGERAKALARDLGDRALSVACDITDASAWHSALGSIEARFGARPSRAALIAGGWAGGAPVHAAKDDAAWHAMLRANADTAYVSLHALLPAMVAAKEGSIVLVGSRAGVQPWTSAGAAAYAASKAAVIALSQAVAQEVLESGVRVNVILPSTMDTPANRKSMPKADPSKWVTTDSVAEVIAFLFSDASRDVSGAAIPVYGRS
jgi:NAD(P)-dependent dehydrogenase (short-subunit alcohol dehydrogenase family)